MKKILNKYFLLLLALSLPGAGLMAAEPQQSFSLQEAIDYALKNNTQVLNADLDNRIAEKQVSEFLADGLPQISANVEMSRNLEIQRAFAPENAFNPNGNPDNVTAIGFAVPNSGLLNVRLDQMLFDGSFFIGLKAARTFTELSRKQHIQSEIDVVEAVNKAYYTVLINYKISELLEKNFTRLDALLSDTEALYENGFVERIDVDRIKVQYNNAKVEFDHAHNLVFVSEQLFKYQIGLPLNTNINLTDDIEAIELKHEVENNKDFNYAKRIEYSSLQTQIELNQIDLKNTKVQYMPKFNVFMNLGANVGTIHTSDLFAFGDWYSFSSVGINAKWNLFDGFRKRSQAQQKKFKATQLEYDLGTIEGGIDIEIDQSLSNYNKSVDNMNAQKENMELAQRIYETTEIKYKEGVGSNSEVLDADNSLKQAQTNYYNALYDALVYRVELQKALGELHQI